MASFYATGPYTAFPAGSQYLCNINFCGWTCEPMTEDLPSGFGFATGNKWDHNAGPYRAREIVFQENGLRTGLIRLGRPFRIWDRPGQLPLQEGEANAWEEIPALPADREASELEARRADLRSMAVHDMKSSLVLIGGFIQRLTSCSDADPERQRRYLGIIQKEGGKLEALLDDFLACTEMQGELRLAIKPTCIDRELQEICEAYQLRGAKRKIALHLEKPERPSFVLADMQRLHRVFANLLDNAFKFSPPETAIQVTLRETAQEVCISFADRGPGIDRRDLPFLFDARYRGRAGIRTEGSGLGLATVKAIIEAHGGRAFAENRPDRGALFSVILPRDGNSGPDNGTRQQGVSGKDQQRLNSPVVLEESAARQP